MADLADLMTLTGAQAAFTINARGELLDHQIVAGTSLDAQALDLLAHMCVANMAIATMQARGWEARSDTGGFYPVQGFTLVGMEWSAVTNGCQGVVIRNDAVDYEAAFSALGEPGGAA